MKKVYVTFGGRAYDATLKNISEQAVPLGADECWIYDDAWLERQPFRKLNRWAWDHPGSNGARYGYGWYCWKPFIIQHALARLKAGDVLLWTDADTYPIADFSRLFDYCARENGFFLFAACGCTNRQYVKRDCFRVIDPLGAISPDTVHATARFMLFQKGRWSIEQFLTEWLAYVLNPLCPTRDPSVLAAENEGFLENRGDQSVFSLLAHKYGLPLHREADAFGLADPSDWDLYPQLFTQEYCAGDRNDLSGSRYATNHQFVAQVEGPSSRAHVE